LAGPSLLREWTGIVDNRRLGRSREQTECLAHHVLLELRVLGRTKRSAQGERYPQCPSRADGLALFTYQADRRAGDTGLLDEVGEGANCARAQRSNRNEERDINAVCGEHSADLTAGVFEQRRIRHRPHERVVPGADATNLT